MNTKIGIAGYMGAGKSTFSRILAKRGFLLIDADQEAKVLSLTNVEIQKTIIDTFGCDVVEHGKLSFAKLGGIVFSSLEQLQKLNSIVHPPLLDLLHSRLQQSLSQPLILDAALIPLWRIDNWFDLRIWVDSSFDVRLSRLIEKCHGLEQSQIVQRMQMQEKLFTPPSSDNWIVFKNDDEYQSLENRVAILIAKLQGFC